MFRALYNAMNDDKIKKNKFKFKTQTYLNKNNLNLNLNLNLQKIFEIINMKYLWVLTE